MGQTEGLTFSAGKGANVDGLRHFGAARNPWVDVRMQNDEPDHMGI